MDKQNKLNAKDLINVGIYTAMYLVVFFVIGMLNAFPHLLPHLTVCFAADYRGSLHAVYNED